MGSPQRLPAGLASMLEDPGHTPPCSVASLWELVIKQAQGRPDFNVQPAVIRRALLDGGWLELPIEAHHALAVQDALAGSEPVTFGVSDLRLTQAATLAGLSPLPWRERLSRQSD